MTRRSHVAGGLVVAAVIAAVAIVAYLLLWTTFMVYDDEGYVLYSLHAFVQHGHLYDRVYSQYGPFFYVLQGALHALGLPFTNTTGREQALICWVGAAAFCGTLVWRETRGSIIAASATVVGVFVHLWSMVAEPGHPGGFITLMTAAAAWCGTRRQWSPPVRAALVGAIGTMLALTKINVGVFLLATGGVWWFLHLPLPSRSRWGRWIAGGSLALLVVALMAKFLVVDWVQLFALVVGGGALAATLSVGPLQPAARPMRCLATAAIPAALIAAITVAVMLLTGTTMRGLLDGVILGPLRHPFVYSVAFTWRTGTLFLACAAVPLAAWLASLPAPRRRPIVIAGRLLVTAAYAACASGVMPIDAGPFTLSYGIITAWVFVLPVRDDDSAAATRGWVALLLIMQALHAYPVAGSQIAWGTFLWVPLAALGIWDLAAFVTSRATRVASITGIAGLTAMVFLRFAVMGYQHLQHSDPIRVTGAEHLRPPALFSSTVRMLVANSQEHADLLFTLPGMMSFNVWTGIAPPTDANATHWFNLLSLAEQDAIQRRLEADPRSAVIFQRALYEFLVNQHVVTRTPLLLWLQDNYAPAFEVDSYQFWVRKGRIVAPLQSARLYTAAPGAATKYKIDVVVKLPDTVTIDRIELRRQVGDAMEGILNWTRADALFIVAPISPEGQMLAPAAERKLPFEAHGLVRIQIFTNTVPRETNGNDAVIYFYDKTGRRVTEARFID